MDADGAGPGFRYLFSAEVAVRPRGAGGATLMELRPARVYLNLATDRLHAVEWSSGPGGPSLRTAFHEDMGDLGLARPLAAPREAAWIGLVSSGRTLAFVAAKIRAAQEARDNGLWWDGDEDGDEGEDAGGAGRALGAGAGDGPDGGLDDF